MRSHLFIRDDKAILEPHNDMLATAIVVIGLVIFMALVAKAYIIHDEQTHSLENYEEASLIAEKLVLLEQLQGTRPNTMSALSLDRITSSSSDHNAKEILYSGFSSNNDFTIEVRTNDGRYEWHISKEESSYPKEVIAASVPVTIETETLQYYPGTLTVKITKKWF